MVLIIAEAGINHNGCLDTAKQLIDMAVEAKADIIKFQTFRSEDLTTKYAPLADYQKTNSPQEISQNSMLNKVELSIEDHIFLKNYSDQKGIEFLSTAFTSESIDLLSKVDIKRWKIPSGEINNVYLLRKIAKFNQPVIVSTGMANLGEIENAIETLTSSGLNKEKITILHCTTAYPAPYEEVNLKAIKTIQKCFDVNVGYSDHTLGIEISIAAVSLGASLIEKHITLDRNMEGPDHKASIEKNELINLVKSIRNVENAIGNGIKTPTNSEKKNLNIARKSIVASRSIKKGETYSKENLTFKRPGNGIPPNIVDFIIGSKANKDYEINEQIKFV